MVNLGPHNPVEESDICQGANLSGTDFSNVDLRKADLAGANVRRQN